MHPAGVVSRVIKRVWNVWGVYNHDFLHVSRVGSAAVPPTGMTNMSQPHWLLLLHTRLESKGNVDKFREMHNKLVWNSS